MNKEEAKWLLETLRTIQFFSTFSLENIDSILSCFQKYSYPAGKTLIKEGTPGEAFFVISRGKAAVLKKGFLWTRKKVTDLVPGSFFGEMSLVLDTPTTATIVTTEPSEVYVLLRSAFEKVVKENPDLANEIKHVAEKRKFESNRY